MADVVVLWCTVSGGLEDFAHSEVQSLFFPADGAGARSGAAAAGPVWRVRGNSGSQLQWTVDCAPDQLEALSQCILQLRMVEYVYVEIRSDSNVCVDSELLARIEHDTMSTCRGHLSAALQLWSLCSAGLQSRSLTVGTEGLPGRLLPTPAVPPAPPPAAATESPDAALQPVAPVEFNVNTVYTCPDVARVVVGTVQALVEADGCAADCCVWVDAGAGSGALLQHLPEHRRVGVDTCPAPDALGVVKIDFLSPDCSPAWIRGHVAATPPAAMEHVCVISNPPFSDGTRGDHSAIVRFINKAVDLGASYVGVIVPESFVRCRIWEVLGLSSRAKLEARFILPKDAFYVPGGGTKHINCYFLFFRTTTTRGAHFEAEAAVPAHQPSAGSNIAVSSAVNIHVVAKRGPKNSFDFATADFTGAVVRALSTLEQEQCGFRLCRSDESQLGSGGDTAQPATLSARLKSMSEGTASFELAMQLNSKLPMSLVNCVSATCSNEMNAANGSGDGEQSLVHSLGWSAASLKPVVAFTMCKLAFDFSPGPTLRHPTGVPSTIPGLFVDRVREVSTP